MTQRAHDMQRSVGCMYVQRGWMTHNLPDWSLGLYQLLPPTAGVQNALGVTCVSSHDQIRSYYGLGQSAKESACKKASS